jgi:hypothetical protein
MLPDEPTDEERQEELAEDQETPFRPADDSQGTVTADDQIVSTPPGPIDDTHPATDTNIDPHELYDEGIAGAAEAGEPSSGAVENAPGTFETDLHGSQDDPRAETGEATPS